MSTRIILVNTTRGGHNSQKQARNDLHEGHGKGEPDPERGSDLLGLVAEDVSELTHAQPGRTVPLPVSLPEVPYLDAVVQTEEEIVQLIKVDELRESILASLQQQAAVPESWVRMVNSASGSPESGA
jgi:hypothetical protein